MRTECIKIEPDKIVHGEARPMYSVVSDGIAILGKSEHFTTDDILRLSDYISSQICR